MRAAQGSQWASAAMTLVTAAEARAGDAYAIAAGDTPAGLMWRAAGQLARGIIAPRTSGYGLRVVMIAGKGNNGGDGYAAALRLTGEYGAHVTVVALDGHQVALSPEATHFRRQWLAAHGLVITAMFQAETAIARADVVVDAVLGTGVDGPLRETAAAAVALLAKAQSAGKKLVACDLPTGVDPDTGTVAAYTVPVAHTISFGAAKRGLLLSPGVDYCGQMTVASLGELWDAYRDEHLPNHTTQPCKALTAVGAAPAAYRATDDKWSRGQVAVLGGAYGTAGACALSALGALNAGAGLVTVYAGAAVAKEIAGSLDAAVMLQRCPPTATTVDGVCSQAWLETVQFGDRADVVVAGPGLGVAKEVRQTVAWLLAQAKRLVLDADALNVFRDDPSALADHAGQVVLTPHRKELARIGGGIDGEDAWTHRIARVPELARKLDATIVAKGPQTLICAPDGRIWVTPVGSPAAGTAGSGDLLSGIIAAAIATAVDVPHAVAQAVWWHGRAAQRAGAGSGGRATVTTLIGELPHVFAELAETSRTLCRAADEHCGEL